jgi:tetratricopeptide (TPR) repeat protein
VQRGQLKEAEHYFQEALVIAREVQEHLIEGWILRLLGQVAQQRGRREEAKSYYQSALKIAKEQNRREEGWVLGNLGDLALQLGQMQEAEHYFNLALAKANEVHNRQGEGWTLWNMGKLAQSLGQVEKAEEYYRQGIEILREVQDIIIYVKAELDFGTFLITQQNKHEEGCSVLMEVIALQHELGLIGEEEARDVAQQLGCM